MGDVHDFRERLEWSASLSDEPSWEAFYRSIWPDINRIVQVEGRCWDQKHGIDREVVLNNGRRFTIDEKKRAKDYGDVLLEVWSVCDSDGTAITGNPETRKIGWALDDEKRCDFIVYAIPSADKAYLLPFEILRLALKSNMREWASLRGCRWPVLAKNRGYYTASIAVPWPILKDAMAAEMVRTWGEVTA